MVHKKLLIQKKNHSLTSSSSMTFFCSEFEEIRFDLEGVKGFWGSSKITLTKKKIKIKVNWPISSAG